MLCDRMNAYKKRYYTLDITVGKIAIKEFLLLLSKEEQLVLELKDVYKEYEKRTSLAMIPHY